MYIHFEKYATYCTLTIPTNPLQYCEIYVKDFTFSKDIQQYFQNAFKALYESILRSMPATCRQEYYYLENEKPYNGPIRFSNLISLFRIRFSHYTFFYIMPLSRDASASRIIEIFDIKVGFSNELPASRESLYI